MRSAVALSAVAGLACLLADRPTIAADAPAWGGIKGVVVYPGDKPPEPVEVVVPPGKACPAKGKIFKEEWVVDAKTLGVANVFVYLAPLDPQGKLEIHPNRAAIPDKAAEIDQPCCAFVPHALAMREGQDLVVKNSSAIPHNANLVADPRFNPAAGIVFPAGPGPQTFKGLKQQRLPIKLDCNIHFWMTANVGVFNHPYFAVTDAAGNFEIKDAPEGPCRLMMWHDTGWVGGRDFNKGREITIKAGQVADLGKCDVKSGKFDAK